MYTSLCHIHTQFLNLHLNQTVSLGIAMSKHLEFIYYSSLKVFTGCAQLMSLDQRCSSILLDCRPVYFFSLACITVRCQLLPLALSLFIYHSACGDMLLELFISYS